ncbi:MAG: response regulator [Elusimicrobia bacterium]|nr:response regulator [Elusimicrobiota bacterium]MBU2614467.1 response regulator [Elusimicrobiota bacterium]
MTKKRIALVDDDIGIQEMLRGELEKSGYEVEVIPDGQLFFEAIAKNKPDLVLLDVSLPGMDGISLCHELKRAPGLNNIPVIMLTAYADKKTVDDLKTFGAEDFIGKPFSISSMKEKIEKILKTREVL